MRLLNSSRLFVCLYQIDNCWTNFNDIWYTEYVLLNCIHAFLFQLKSHKTDTHLQRYVCAFLPAFWD
jgi:hypothetical protein